MPRGTVKWFNNAKGFGFILPDGGGDDLFAHYSSIEMDGYKTLKAGQPVNFEVEDGDKGPHASHIQPAEEQGASIPENQNEAQSASSSDADEFANSQNNELQKQDAHELEGAH